MTLSEILSAFRQRRLSIDCVEMTLTQNTVGQAISFKGPGYIRQGEDDRLGFKIYAIETANTDPVQDLNRIARQTAGTLFRDTDYYALGVVAADGTRWTAGRILPDLHWPKDSGNPIVSGAVATLTAECPMPERGSSVVVHYFGDTRIPCIMDEFSFSAAGCEFTVRKGDGEFTVEARGAAVLAEGFPLRAQEALRFLLGQSVDWRVLSCREGGRQRLQLASVIERARRPQLGRPIDGSVGTVEDCWRLFGQYLEYVITTKSASSWSRCSYYLYNACEASTGSVDAWAIGVSVAVEGIANLIQCDLPPDDKKRLSGLTNSVLEHIASKPCFASFAGRVKGLLGMMQNVRVQDRLRPLTEAGHADGAYLKAWSELRNKHVHPGELESG